ncbi:hypothetical protein FOMA001_g12660 [Fusarium oxysporum f. sp. matthiolae]|nr:hypothetical protein FOMA001_g12660 [Fusarium oxysporum f. sp. matthiolae]
MNHADYDPQMGFLNESSDDPDEKTKSSLLRHPIGKPEEKRKKKEKYKDLTGDYWNNIKPRGTREDKTQKPSNGCYPLQNVPLPCQRVDYNFARLNSYTEVLKYDCFMPTGDVYEFLPCAPYSNAGSVLGYKKVYGMDAIMEIEGTCNVGLAQAFAPYKLLVYRGRFNNDPERDDNHRFVYLAQNKPREPAVGDCFIRLEEVHHRMRGDPDFYYDDCSVAINRARILRNIAKGTSKQQREGAKQEYEQTQRQGRSLLTFRCWTVEGIQCSTSEKNLAARLFKNLSSDNDDLDHVQVFRVWAELLRKSQGDKLAAKDFFGRYWDAVIPQGFQNMFEDGFKIVVGEKYLQGRGIFGFNLDNMREEVFQGVKRVVEAPRLKFKPTLSVNNVVFQNEAPQGPGWVNLEAHPGGLYVIMVDYRVQLFLCSGLHDKPLWQDPYPEPDMLRAEQLQALLNRCGQTEQTVTHVENVYVDAARNGKRQPTQDRCVADNGFSSNVAMSKVYPEYYPDAAKAKRRRVAEWLHRSAFSYGGIDRGVLASSQVANNLVLGTPDTNTVMMRYEAFVKRLALHSVKQNGVKTDTVVVKTDIMYPFLQAPLLHWMANDHHRYTWLAPILLYRYENTPNSRPHVVERRELYPLRRVNSMLFQALLDKSLEAICWNWPCWDVNGAVVEALLESTGVDGDQEENNPEEMNELLGQDLAQRDQQV